MQSGFSSIHLIMVLLWLKFLSGFQGIKTNSNMDYNALKPFEFHLLSCCFFILCSLTILNDFYFLDMLCPLWSLNYCILWALPFFGKCLELLPGLFGSPRINYTLHAPPIFSQILVPYPLDFSTLCFCVLTSSLLYTLQNVFVIEYST